MTALCPNCGTDLVAEAPVTLGALEYDPRGAILWHGKPVPLTPGERIVLETVVREAPRAATRTSVRERLGADEYSDSNVAEVLMCRVRRKMREVGPEAPIEALRGVGWRWVA